MLLLDCRSLLMSDRVGSRISIPRSLEIDRINQFRYADLQIYEKKNRESGQDVTHHMPHH